MTLLLAIALTLSQQNSQTPSPISLEQGEIYRAVLNAEKALTTQTINLDNTLVPMAKADGCLEGLGLENPTGGSQKLSATDVHDLPVVLVESPPNSKVPAASGTPLTTLSIIRFNSAHTIAAVSVSFHCGEMCGHLYIYILQKADGRWSVSPQSLRCIHTQY